MAKHRFVVHEGINKVPGTVAWEYQADNNGIKLSNGYKTIKVEGDFIGKECMFNARGRRSEFIGIVLPPRDERSRVLWKHGFTMPTRVNKNTLDQYYDWQDLVDRKCGYDPNDGIGYGCNESGVFVNSANVKTTVIKRDGRVVVATAIGRELNQDKGVMLSYMDAFATMDDLNAWEEEYERVG